MISKQRRAWAAASGSTPPPGRIGAVPDTKTRSPTRSARLNPIRSSNGDPDVARRRSTWNNKPHTRKGRRQTRRRIELVSAAVLAGDHELGQALRRLPKPAEVGRP